MADNTSATGGCLRPIPPLELDEEGEGLDEGILDGPVVLVGSIDGTVAAQRMGRFLQAWIACVTGLDGTLVRPRWQPEPPNMPAVGANWAAFGVTPAAAETFAFVGHVAEGETEGDGFDQLLRSEEMDVLVSFFGPSADGYARALRDNIQIGQNRAVLGNAQMGLIETSEITAVPSLVKDKWKYRADITVRLRWLIQKQYRVQNIASATVGLKVGEAVGGGTIDEEITTQE